jgi:hypothetical protein
LTKGKDDFVRGKEAFIGETAELERVMRKLEGKRGRNCVLHHTVDPDTGGFVSGGGHHQTGRTARAWTI